MVNHVIITDKGRKAYEKAHPLYLKMVDQLTGNLKDREIDDFEKVLDKVKENLGLE